MAVLHPKKCIFFPPHPVPSSPTCLFVFVFVLLGCSVFWCGVLCWWWWWVLPWHFYSPSQRSLFPGVSGALVPWGQVSSDVPMVHGSCQHHERTWWVQLISRGMWTQSCLGARMWEGVSIPSQFSKCNIGVYLWRKLPGMALTGPPSDYGLFLKSILRFVTLSQAWNREAKPITVFQISLLGPGIKYCKISAHMFWLALTTDIGLYLKLAFSSPCSYCWDKNSTKHIKENFHLRLKYIVYLCYLNTEELILIVGFLSNQ